MTLQAMTLDLVVQRPAAMTLRIIGDHCQPPHPPTHLEKKDLHFLLEEEDFLPLEARPREPGLHGKSMDESGVFGNLDFGEKARSEKKLAGFCKVLKVCGFRFPMLWH